MQHKRLIAFLLCVMMLVSLLPAAVFADEADDEAIVEVAFEENAEEPAEETAEEAEENEAASEDEESVADEEAVEGEEIIEEDEIVEDEQPAEDEEFDGDEIAEEPETEAEENEFEAVASGKCGVYLSWTLDSTGKLTISGTGAMNNYDAYSSNYYAPWYTYRSKIKTVVIENGVTSIGDCAFCDLYISDISIPDSITYIGYLALNCAGGLTSIFIPASVTDFGVFYTPDLIEITVGNGNPKFKSINGVLFSLDGTTLLMFPFGRVGTYSIPAGVKSIRQYAFENSNVGFIVIPSSVENIGEGAFDNAGNLTYIYVSEDNKNYKSIDGVLFSADGKTLIRCPERKEGVYSIPNGVTEIGNAAFSYCGGLSDIIIPNSVTKIDNYAFYWCANTTKMTIPNSTIKIGECAFVGINCESIIIPESVTDIGFGAFEMCLSLKEIKFLGNAPSMGDVIFYGVNATAYYPAGNKTWTNVVMQQYGGNITWMPYGGHPTPVLQTPANHENFMIIQWSKCEGATGYRLQYREGSGAWTEVKVALTQVNSKGEPRWDYKNAKDGATYTFRVFADFIDGTTTESNRMGQMRLRTPKIKVSHFGGSDLGGGFRIDWEATNGGSQYKIYYREKGTSAWTLYTMMPKSSNTTFLNIKASVISANPNMPNLIAGHTYEFMVLTCTTVASVTSGYPTPFVSMKF